MTAKKDEPIATSIQHAAPAAATSSSITPRAATTATTVQIHRPTAIPLPTRMVLSAVAGMGAATVCHPLDVIRVQMQVHHFRNSYHAATSIYQNAGLRNGLYAGISAAYLRQWLYGSCRMGIFSYLLEREKLKTGSDQISFGTKLIMGSISGAIGSFVGTPSEVALVRMSADSKLPVAERRNYSSVGDCLARIGREEGVLKMWRGAMPTVLRATLLSSCQMGITSEAKGRLSKSGYFGENGQWLGGYPVLFFSTLLSSFCANIVANPFDVVKVSVPSSAGIFCGRDSDWIQLKN